MVHRILARRGPRVPGARTGDVAAIRSGTAVVLVGVLALLLAQPAAWAFCRTTTCAVKKPPASCIRDPDTGCWATGIPLTWTEQCVSFSVNVAGSSRLGLDYDAARMIVEEAFSHWPNASCSDGAPSIAFAHRPGLTCDR